MDLLTLTVIAAQTPHRKLGYNHRSWVHASCALAESNRVTQMLIDKLEVPADWELGRALVSDARCWICHTR